MSYSSLGGLLGSFGFLGRITKVEVVLINVGAEVGAEVGERVVWLLVVGTLVGSIVIL